MDREKVRLPTLRLRTALPMETLAEAVAYVLWNELSREGGCENLQAHRYPALARDLEAVLSQRIGRCDAVTVTNHVDAWAHTGGGVPTPAQRLPVCPEHAQLLTTQVGALLQDLLNAVEKTTRDFLGPHASPFSSALTPEAAVHIERAIEKAVKPYLIQNLASDCCDTCEQARVDARRIVS